MAESDFGNLARYKAALLPTLLPGEQRVVFFGDSITELWALDVAFPTKAYINRGISGQSTSQMMLRFRQDVINIHATTVVILAGINDLGGMTGYISDADIEDNLMVLCEQATTHGIAVVLASLLPTSNYHGLVPPRTQTHPLSRINAINAWMKTYAQAHHYVYLDYYSAMTDSSGLMREDLTADDLHPNAKGYAIMGPLVEAAIQRSIGEG